jgi:hypothetical protein
MLKQAGYVADTVLLAIHDVTPIAQGLLASADPRVAAR